jgi:hypothetical protein
VLARLPAYRHFMAVNPKSMNIIKTGGRFGIFTKLRAIFRFRAPVGFQDETGFHLGKELAHNEPGHSFRLQKLNKSNNSN